MGNKVLRQRLRGPAMVQYYPAKGPGLKDLLHEFKGLGLEIQDEKWDDWQEHIAGLVHINELQ